ncbi:polysaccharide biosynthesis/export family protein [Arcticibacter eurypsychrophilus]|uniref:polysaccharide biosynthesis/export family protein n=1 Tax=Arcticibacter eurypsychrophilus TaxID=1434752 RepID=UPI00084DD232|nr:polysaccharide biosynthesis/export family protein [Arcticibacter eurypsychrophilus]
MSKFFIFQAFLLIVLLSSCNSYKKIPYFQNLNRSGTLQENVENFSPLTIQPEDILGINVTSLNPGAWQDSTNKAEYLVNQDGEIQLPLIGTIKVSGLTATVAQKQIQAKLLAYLKMPTVNVRIINFKVSVLGDVAHPDVFKVSNTRITLLEALSLAGDLNITAKRTDVLLIREVNGKRAYLNIDLTSASTFKSSSYYLKNNDVIYVQPDKTKYASVDNSYRTVSILLSALSVVAIVITSILN